ncbi:MAG: sporulation domain-containing [Gallionellaceae bacterium]|nr:MAG: sporulation domain-containing [Gallionellaceae bacterium]
MSKNSSFKQSHLVYGLLLSAMTWSACAAPLDDVSVQQQNNVALATIKLTTQVHFLRYVPGGKSRILEIYYERIPSSNPSDVWVDREVRKAPETMLTPAFSVTTFDQAGQPKLVVEFAREVEFSVSAGADNRSFVITIKPEKIEAQSALALPLLPTVLPPVIDKAAPEATDNNQQGYKLMQAGRDALAAKNYPAATEAFNKLLMLPPNQYSQDAQEWVGVARERGGEPAKAKVEYELYLKLYTTGPGVQWVKQRLAGLALPVTTAKMETAEKKIAPRSFVQGGISSRYYYGQSKIDTTYQFNNATRTDTYSIVDQSSLISNVDATGRYVDETHDNRIVFRDVHTKNMLPGKTDRNRINSAYVEYKNRTEDYSARLGRQTTGGGGVMGRFDGIAAGYGSPQDFRVNGVAGQLVDFTFAKQPIFYGVSVDKGPVSIYLLNQTLEGIQDRRALGGEFKYFEGGKTAFAMLDYDIYFKVLNATMLTGSWLVEATGTTYNFIADYRKSPSINIRNALNGAATTSVKDLLAVMSEAQLQQLARDRTANSAFSQLGISQKLSPTWQLGGDIKLAQTGGLPASGIDPNTGVTGVQGYVAAYPSTGMEKTLTAQLIGSNLYSEADITTFGGSYITSGYVKSGQSVFVYNRTSWDNEYYVDTSWYYYNQTDNYGGKMARHTPTVRVAYQMLQELSLDAEFGAELSDMSGPFQTSVSTRIFGSLGFRWDF